MIATYLLLGAVSLFLCLLAHPIGRLLGILDTPDGERKTHSQATPLVGGIAVMVPVVTMCGVLAVATPMAPLYATLGVTAAAFLLVGLIDDRGQIRPIYRLLLSTILCLGAVLAVPALGVDFLLFSFYPHLIAPGAWLMLGFSLLCLVGVQNATNMADGKDGLAIGLSLLWTGLLFAHAPRSPATAAPGAGRGSGAGADLQPVRAAVPRRFGELFDQRLRRPRHHLLLWGRLSGPAGRCRRPVVPDPGG